MPYIPKVWNDGKHFNFKSTVEQYCAAHYEFLIDKKKQWSGVFRFVKKENEYMMRLTFFERSIQHTGSEHVETSNFNHQHIYLIN